MPESLIIESVAENQRLNEDDGSGHGNDNSNVAEQVNTMSGVHSWYHICIEPFAPAFFACARDQSILLQST